MLVDTENRLVVSRDRGWLEAVVMDEGGQKVQTVSYKTNDFWGWNAIINNIILYI